MNIVSLFDTLLTSIFAAEQSFFENPKNFSELKSSVKSSTDTFAYLLEDLIGLERNERFTEVAESFMLCEALKTSYAEAAKVLPSKQEITKTTVMNKVHSIADEIPDKIYDNSQAC